jgi:O-antigen/teichoic acid export membrane protein
VQRDHTQGDKSALLPGDRKVLASGTAQNIVGIVVAGIALLGVQILTSRALGPSGFGTVTLLTQAAFVVSFATRAGMDMAVLRDVAIQVGGERPEKVRRAVSRAALIAVLVSSIIAVFIVLFRAPVGRAFSLTNGTGFGAVTAAAVGLPAIAATNVWLFATRGLKIMRYTLYIFFVGQNLLWIILSLVAWQFSRTPTASVAAYSMSWVLSSVAAATAWRRESANWPAADLDPRWLDKLIRYAGPRAPAALFAQLLFWTDLFVVTHYVSEQQVGVYSAALRAGQILLLLLASANLIFAPFVADLHRKGETQRLDELFKTLTRWIVAGTLPLLLLIVIAPDEVLALFGPDFSSGRDAVLILLIGQFFNAASGSGGLVLIMIGRTGYDLAVYAGSLVIALVLALLLAPRFGIAGAATANAGMFAISNITRLVLVKRFAGIYPYDRSYLRLALPAALTGVVMWGVNALVNIAAPLEVFLIAMTGGLVFCAAMVVWGLSPEERSGAARLTRHFRSD